MNKIPLLICFLVIHVFIAVTHADEVKDLQNRLERIPLSDKVELLLYDPSVKRKGETKREATTKSAKVKAKLTNWLMAYKWTYRPDMGEAVGTSTAIHLYFKEKDESFRISLLAHRYLVLACPNQNKLWFDAGHDADINDGFLKILAGDFETNK